MSKAIKKSLPRQIAELLEEQIRTQKYKVGDKLPAEPVLCETYGVSRNTVREAIQSLIRLGLLETRQGDGTYVTASERLQVEFYNIMDSSTYQDVREFRDLLERHVALSAIRNRTDADVEVLEQLLNRRSRPGGDLAAASQADLNFHMALAQATHNDIILSVYRYVSDYFNQFIYDKMDHPSCTQADVDRMHIQLFHAIRDRNEALALNSVNQIIQL